MKSSWHMATSVKEFLVLGRGSKKSLDVSRKELRTLGEFLSTQIGISSILVFFLSNLTEKLKKISFLVTKNPSKVGFPTISIVTFHN